MANRNRLLKQINDGLANPDELEYWDTLLVQNSNVIQKYRKQLIDFLNNYLKNNFIKIGGKSTKLKINYDYKQVSIPMLQEKRQIEILGKGTKYGAQKDDFEIYFYKGHQLNVARYFASRGEQRTISFALKLGALDYLKQELDGDILILLDDLYSELDTDHRKNVTNIVKNENVIITTAERSLIPKSILKDANIIKL